MKADKHTYGILTGWVSILLNTFLFGIKLWAGIVSNSIALIADAWHTLTDSISSVVLIIGLRVAKKPADGDHPFGHGRAELISSIIIGILLVGISINFLIESVTKLTNREMANFGPLALWVTIISIVVKEGMAQMSFIIAKRIHSVSLKADGWHHRSDAISSVIILVGILLKNYFWWMDAVLGIVVSILIGYAAYSIIKESSHKILGEIPDKKLVHAIKQLGKEVYPDDLEIHHVHIHDYGQHIEMTFHIKLPNDMQIKQANEITRLFREKIWSKLQIESTIYIDKKEL